MIIAFELSGWLGNRLPIKIFCLVFILNYDCMKECKARMQHTNTTANPYGCGKSFLVWMFFYSFVGIYFISVMSRRISLIKDQKLHILSVFLVRKTSIII